MSLQLENHLFVYKLIWIRKHQTSCATVQIFFLQDQIFFYLPSAKAVITSLSDERERNLFAEAAARHVGYKIKRQDRESSK